MGLNLVTKAQYKTYANITSTNMDESIDLLIPKVSEFVKSYCRRTFVDHFDQAKIETFHGGFSSLILKESPVISVSNVQYSSDFGQTYTKLTKYVDWIDDGDSIVALNPGGFTKQINGYKVTYFAGYEAVPPDLILAVYDLITYYRRHDGSVHSARNPGSNTMQIEYISSTALPANIKRVLDLYTADYT